MASRRRVVQAILLGPPALAAFGYPLRAGSFGTFRGRVVTEWLKDHREMKLLEPFEFVGVSDRRWPVPKGTIVDGASIPKVFWSIIGGPFEGAYRNASVIHDFYCQTRTRTYQDVHQMFYDGMRASGVGSARARIMYEAVSRFGPSWDNPNLDPECEVVDENYDFEKCALNWRRPELQTPDLNKTALLKFADEVQSYANSEDIRRLKDSIEKL